MENLADKTQHKKVIVTGGSRGIGRGISHVLAESGYEVIVIGKSPEAQF